MDPSVFLQKLSGYSSILSPVSSKTLSSSSRIISETSDCCFIEAQCEFECDGNGTWNLTVDGASECESYKPPMVEFSGQTCGCPNSYPNKKGISPPLDLPECTAERKGHLFYSGCIWYDKQEEVNKCFN
jgi:hypothetical protein